MKNIDDLKTQLERTKAELNRLYLVNNAMRTTLKLDEILFIILTSVTAKEGLGFNRAMLFLIDKEKQILEGKMGIGPKSGKEAAKIWRQIEAEKVSFEDLISAYKNLDKDGPNTLNAVVKTIKIPLEEIHNVLIMTALEAMPLEFTTAPAKEKVNFYLKERLELNDFVTVPLEAKKESVGVILADNKFSGKPITKEDIRILSMFANQAGLAIENSMLYEVTEKMARTDLLTNLYNYGHFQRLLAEEMKRAQRLNYPLSIIILDIDHFKIYNDTLGHPAGDNLLKTLSDIILDNLREIDTAARYGGEEFVIILPQTPKNDAAGIAERIRKKVEHFAFNEEHILPHKKLTISLGIANFPEDTQEKDKLIHLADKALYKAKRSGRNKVCTV